MGTSTPGDGPRRMTGVTGRVTRGPFGAGSKSEHDATWLDTSQGRYVLRRRGGPAMGDAALDRYVGCTVRCDGVLLSHTLIADAIEIVW